ncbi:DNA translocase FtsK 4TM domain-containing protein [Thermoproteota archaeon]
MQKKTVKIFKQASLNNQLKHDSKKKEPQRRSKRHNSIYADFWALILAFTAAFIFITNIHPNTTGVVGYWGIQVFGNQAVGNAVVYLPAFLLVFCFALIFSTARWKQAVIALITSFLAFTVLLEQLAIGHYNPPIWPPTTLNGGGLMGGAIIYVLNKIVGINGTWILIYGVFSVSLVALFEISLRAALTRLFKHIKSMFWYTEKKPVGYQPIMIKKRSWLKKAAIWLFTIKIKQAGDVSLETISIPRSKSLSKIPETVIEADQSAQTALPKPEIKIDLPPEENPSKTPQPVLESANEKSTYKFPSLTLLEKVTAVKKNTQELLKEHQERSANLEEALISFNVDAKVVHISPGPTVTRYELQPGPGVKISKITALSKDIALKLAAPDVRIEAPIPGKALIGIEVPNPSIETVTLRDIIDRTDFMTKPSKLTAAIGLTITGGAILMDLAKMPHVLIAGATGSGKSVCVNSIILSIILRATPEEVKFLMIDPKKVELSMYEGIPHLIAPVVTNPHLAAATLKKWALTEMERRYDVFSASGVKHIQGYNERLDEIQQLHAIDPSEAQKSLKKFLAKQFPDQEDPVPIPVKLPYIVVIIDELADLMMVASQDVENTICRLAQMSRATGIHLVIATQRPSVNVVTGLIKANVPSRISFFLQSQIDSRTILDMPGAEKLLGRGDMLYSPVGSFKPKRVQGAFVTEKELKNVVNFLKKQGRPEYLSEIMEVEPLSNEKGPAGSKGDRDELFNEAKEIVMNTRYASTSFLQRKLRIGYNRAARIMDELELEGVISEYAGEKKPRSIVG